MQENQNLCKPRNQIVGRQPSRGPVSWIEKSIHDGYIDTPKASGLLYKRLALCEQVCCLKAEAFPALLPRLTASSCAANSLTLPVSASKSRAVWPIVLLVSGMRALIDGAAKVVHTTSLC